MEVDFDQDSRNTYSIIELILRETRRNSKKCRQWCDLIWTSTDCQKGITGGLWMCISFGRMKRQEACHRDAKSVGSLVFHYYDLLLLPSSTTTTTTTTPPPPTPTPTPTPTPAPAPAPAAAAATTTTTTAMPNCNTTYLLSLYLDSMIPNAIKAFYPGWPLQALTDDFSWMCIHVFLQSQNDDFLLFKLVLATRRVNPNEH